MLINIDRSRFIVADSSGIFDIIGYGGYGTFLKRFFNIVDSYVNINSNLTITEPGGLESLVEETDNYINILRSNVYFRNLNLTLRKATNISNQYDRIVIDSSNVVINSINYNKELNPGGGTSGNMLSDFHVKSGSVLNIQSGKITNKADSFLEADNSKGMLYVEDSKLILKTLNSVNGGGIYSDRGGLILNLVSSKLVVEDYVEYLGRTDGTIPANNNQPLFKFINSDVFMKGGTLDFKSGDWGDTYIVLIDYGSNVYIEAVPTLADINSMNLRDATNVAYTVRHAVEVRRGSKLIIKQANTVDGGIAFWSSQIDATPTYQVFYLGSLGAVSGVAEYPDGVLNDIDVISGVAGTPSNNELAIVICKLLTV